MSYIKENPNSKIEDLKKIEKRFEKMNKKNVWLSEAAELARMNWWTIEYGLVGDLKKEPVHKIWHGEKLQKVRDLHKSFKGYLKSDVCGNAFSKSKVPGREE